MTDTLMLYTGAITLGAFHAFEPGHGKTLIAAYMVGTKGRPRDGIFLGGIVTFTHTFSVLLLGMAASLLSRTYSDEVLHNWLGLVSAGLILVVGLWMLRQRLFVDGGHHHHFHLFGKGHSHHDHPQQHHHDDAHSHEHHNHSHENSHTHTHTHSHGHAHEDAEHQSHSQAPKPGPQKLNTWNLLLLGISGGLIPCPAAIAVLLAAIAAGKIAQGLSVTIFFSLGLGLVMMSIGIALSQAGRLTTAISDNIQLSRQLGIASSFIIVCIGFYTMFNSIKNIWF